MAMLPSDSELIEEVCEISAAEEFKKSCYGVARGTLITGGATLLATIALGPVGLLIGAAAGGGTAYATSTSFKSVPQILMNLNHEDKREFGRKLRGLLTVRNVTSVTALVATRGGLDILMTFIHSFFKESLKIQT